MGAEVRGRGITRHGEARYERAYGRSYEGQFAFHGGPGIPPGIWRNLRGEERGEEGAEEEEGMEWWGQGAGQWGGWRGGGVGGAVNSRTVLKAANLVNAKEHMEGKKASGQVGAMHERGHAHGHARLSASRPGPKSVMSTHARGFRNKPPINRREMSE